ncbi:pyridoxamine 5'-phosphate oxidase family protein [Streptomyces sp. NPDC053755]|uniref:pyridoxamine 5'-phosphate oxidase family protein n=1 Tax=Streptomyces sp. NPDC053755 TaxID=3155815 RepID=UPI003418ABFD
MGVYHQGERSVQERAGLLDHAGFSSAAIKDEIPDIAVDFLAQQPMLVIGAAGDDGAMWASLLTGAPGFLTASGPASLAIEAALPAGDPLHRALTRPARLGMIAIEPATRRRMRMNGTARPTAGGLHADLDQVYANCPKYIQKRQPLTASAPPAVPAPPRIHSGELTPAQMALVQAADTFFIATADREGNADASHRGGHPGFLQVLSPTRLRWPDYVGNAMFGTLGNLEVDPRAGLLLPDWSTGTLLQLTGTATVDWDPGHAAALPGAQRIVEFTVEHAVQADHASPLRWSAPQYSRFNPPAPPALSGPGL